MLHEDRGATAHVLVRTHRTTRSLVLPETFIGILIQEEQALYAMVGFQSLGMLGCSGHLEHTCSLFRTGPQAC